ncbi:MAG: HAD family hydrolase [Candidatus Azotimanducaceae bacterium WSBS_2022_MAG_OTU7]
MEASLNAHLNEQDATSCAQSAMEIFLAARNDVVFEGTLETLRNVAQSFQLGAITNGNADIYRLGLNDCFQLFAFSAEQVGAPKPAPDLFHAALAHTGCEPAQMVYVGDDPIKDVDAANEVGLHTIWMRSESKPPKVNRTPMKLSTI